MFFVFVFVFFYNVDFDLKVVAFSPGSCVTTSMSGGYVAGGSWSSPGEKVPPNSPAGWVVVSFTDERVWSSEKVRNMHQVTQLPTDQQVFAPFIRSPAHSKLPTRPQKAGKFGTPVVSSALMLMLFTNLGMALSLQNRQTNNNKPQKLHSPIKIHFIPVNLQVGCILDVVLACLV